MPDGVAENGSCLRNKKREKLNQNNKKRQNKTGGNSSMKAFVD
jgi:hypothetical protein